MKRHDPRQKINCFTIRLVTSCDPGIATDLSGKGRRQVTLSPKKSRRRRGMTVLSRSAGNEITFGRVAADKSLSLGFGRGGKAREFLFLVSGVYEAEQLHGNSPTRIFFHDCKRTLTGGDGVMFTRRHPATALVRLTWEPDRGSFHETTALRLKSRGRGEIVIGLSSVETTPDGWPIPWVRAFSDYGRLVSESARELDQKLLRLRR